MKKTLFTITTIFCLAIVSLSFAETTKTVSEDVSVTIMGVTTTHKGREIPDTQHVEDFMNNALTQYRESSALTLRLLDDVMTAAENNTSANQKEVFDAVRVPAADIVRIANRGEMNTPVSLVPFEKKNATEVKKLKKASKAKDGRIANLASDVKNLKNQMAWFFTPQAMPVFVAQDASAPFGVKLYPVKIADSLTLGDPKTMPRHILNYNTITGTDTKCMNVFWVGKSSVLSSDQNGFGGSIWGARDIARSHANNLFTKHTNTPTEIDGKKGHIIIVTQVSDIFMNESLLHENLDYRGVHSKDDRQFLIGESSNCK